MSTAEISLDWLRGYLGFTEGNNNHNVFAAMAGHLDHLPWCATTLVAMARSTFLELPPGASSPYTPAMLAAFRAAGRVVDTPQRGDWGFLFYRSLNRVGHVFAVDAVDAARGHVRTLEGNTNQAGSATGGQVASLVRDYRARGGSAWVAAFVRPDYDGVPVRPVNVAGTAERTGALIVPAAYVTAPPTSDLLVDGELGSDTIRRWQGVMGTTADGVIDTGKDGSELVKAVQRLLNAQVGAGLKPDGHGIRQDGRPYKTTRALQAYLGTPRDGRLDLPKSEAVKALQRRLNANTFLPGRALVA